MERAEKKIRTKVAPYIEIKMRAAKHDKTMNDILEEMLKDTRTRTKTIHGMSHSTSFTNKIDKL